MPDNSKSSFADQAHAFIAGCIAGVIEVGANHPLFQLKVLFQGQQKEITPLHEMKRSWDTKNIALAKQHFRPAVKFLYKGIELNALGMVPTTAVQMLASYNVQKILEKHTDQDPVTRKFFGGAVGGAFAATIASPVEYVIIQQRQIEKKHGVQLSGFKVSAGMYHELGYKMFTHGLAALAGRDVIFTVGYQAINPLVKEQVEKYIEHPFQILIATNVMVGIPVSLISHPLDTISTVQKKSQGKLSFFEARRAIYFEAMQPKTLTDAPVHWTKGVKAFYGGGFFRTARVVMALTEITAVTDHYHKEIRGKMPF